MLELLSFKRTSALEYMSIFILLFSLVFVSPLLAQSNTQFSQEELSQVKKRYGNISLNRIADYQERMSDFKGLSSEQKLSQVNTYLNKLLPEYDAVRNNKEEYWGTPREFLTMGTGDCEDYVAIKYYSLIDLGFDANALFFAIVKDTYSGSYHMVLLYEKNPGMPPLVLDNLSFRILPLSARTDLTLVDLFNDTGRFQYSGKYEKIPQKGNYTEFIDLQNRIRSGE